MSPEIDAPTANTGVTAGKSDSPAARDRRRSPRYPCNGTAEITSLNKDRLIRGQLKDISEHGCFVASIAPVKLDVHTAVDIKLTVNGKKIHLQAVVANLRSETGAGFEFQFSDHARSAPLRDLIIQLSTKSGG